MSQLNVHACKHVYLSTKCTYYGRQEQNQIYMNHSTINVLKIVKWCGHCNDQSPRCNRGLTDEKQEAHGPHHSPEKTVQNQ